ncbi:hypothetical protein U1Q18_018076 [Sarracenia purpurea var. burkii]
MSWSCLVEACAWGVLWYQRYRSASSPLICVDAQPTERGGSKSTGLDWKLLWSALVGSTETSRSGFAAQPSLSWGYQRNNGAGAGRLVPP